MRIGKWKIKSMFEFIKYEIWPWVKVRSIYFWWTIKYGGKKNIPQELIFNRMQKSLENSNKNLMNALRVMPDDISADKKEELMNLLRTGAKLDKEVKDVVAKKRLENRNK